MDIKKYRPILELVLVSDVAYILHKFFFYLKASNPNYQDLYYPLETIYGFFFACSAIIILILIKVKERSFENVGYVFLLLTCIKMGVSYVLLKPILQFETEQLGPNKVNFFIVFALFLTIETVVTSRILNNKQ